MSNEVSNQMRVIFIARNYPPDVGGAEKLNFDLAKRLDSLVELKVIRNPFGKHSPLFYPYALLRYTLCRLRKGVDLVLLSDAMLAPLTPIIKVMGSPIVLKAHGLDITYPNPLYQFMLRRFARFADKVICISCATRDEMVNRGLNPSKCEVIPVGIDPEEYLINEDRQKLRERAGGAVGVNMRDKEVLLSVGRLVERKGFHWFVENVMPDLLKARKDILYLIAGEGEMQEMIERSIDLLGLEENVRLLGKVDIETLKLLYNSSDIFIMPNIEVEGDMEGFGIVALEASSCGLPVVASELEGITSAAQDRRNGLLVKPYCIDEYVQGITELLSDRQKRDRLGKAAQEFAEVNYSWGNIIRQYLVEFDSVV